MTHKGYTAAIEVDEDGDLLFGYVIGLQDIITFQGETVAEARQAFRDSVDDYLDFCASRGESPEKPFSGRFLVRIAPSLHRSLVEHATTRGLSLNALVEQTLSDEFAKDEPKAEPRKTKPKSKPRAKAASKTVATPA